MDHAVRVLVFSVHVLGMMVAILGTARHTTFCEQ